MAIAESVKRLGATLFSIVGTRLELAAVEIEEETLRLFSLLMVALGALFFLCIAIMLAIVLVLAVFWESHRIPVLLGMIGVFALAAGMLALGVRNSYRQKPKLMGHTLAELAKDGQSLRAD